MLDRRFTDIDLRTMLDVATGISRDAEPGRWRIETQHRLRPWIVFGEPDAAARGVVVVTAYDVD